MTPKAEAAETKVELWGGLRPGSFPHTGSHQLDEEAHQEVGENTRNTGVQTGFMSTDTGNRACQ